MAMRPAPPRPKAMRATDPVMVESRRERAVLAIMLIGAVVTIVPFCLAAASVRERQEAAEKARFMSACMEAGYPDARCRFMHLQRARAEADESDKRLGTFIFGLALGAGVGAK